MASSFLATLLAFSSSALAAPSLLKRQDTLAPALSTHKFNNYDALGDSYSAGPGQTDQVGDDASGPDIGKQCYRHSRAWPELLREQLGIPSQNFTFGACSGLDTLDIRNGEILDDASGFSSPDLVTITMGGNNGGSFTKVVENCATVVGKCDDALALSNDTLNSPNMTAEIWATLDAAGQHNAVPGVQRTVLAMGYPVPFNSDTKPKYFDVICGTSPEQRGSINSLGLRLDAMIRAAVNNATATNAPYRAIYVDPNPTFNGHRICEDGGPDVEWFQGTVNLEDLQDGTATIYNGFLHPNAGGHSALASAAMQALAASPA